MDPVALEELTVGSENVAESLSVCVGVATMDSEGVGRMERDVERETLSDRVVVLVCELVPLVCDTVSLSLAVLDGVALLETVRDKVCVGVGAIDNVGVRVLVAVWEKVCALRLPLKVPVSVRVEVPDAVTVPLALSVLVSDGECDLDVPVLDTVLVRVCVGTDKLPEKVALGVCGSVTEAVGFNVQVRDSVCVSDFVRWDREDEGVKVGPVGDFVAVCECVAVCVIDRVRL